jgi:hypothetical protein
LAWARDAWLAACALPAGEAGWEIFRQQAEKLAPRVTHPALLPLLKRTVESADGASALESVLALLANRPMRTWTDADVERFEAQAQYVGRLFREERDGEMQIASLPADLQVRSRQIAQEMNAYLAQLNEDPQVLRAALQELLRELR